jgi:hypothetical protein
MVSVDASQMTMRLIGSPAEILGVDPVSRNACGQNQPLEGVRLRAGTAQENISVGEGESSVAARLAQACREPPVRGPSLGYAVGRAGAPPEGP